MSHIEIAGRNTLVARRLASCTVRSPRAELLRARRVAVCRLSDMSSAAAAAHSGS